MVLHDFGFRPDLTRRSEDARIADRNRRRPTAESVSFDVLETMCERKEELPSLGEVADLALQTFYIHNTAHHIHEPTFQYMLAAVAVGRTSESLILDTLRTLAQSTLFTNQDPALAFIDTMKLLASIPDSYQQHRIDYMMLCDKRVRDNEPPYGLCLAAKNIFNTARRQMYSHQQNDMQPYYDRYVYAVKELLPIDGVVRWLQDNRPHWSFMEREITAASREQQHRYQYQGVVQSRGDYSGRRDADLHNVDVPDHIQHSDSDNAGILESEDDDDSALHDTRYDEEDSDMMNYQNDLPQFCIVQGAGHEAVNGEYHRVDNFEGACRFSRKGRHNGNIALFSIFMCNVSDSTQHWYISVVPNGSNPGTCNDIDFYSAPVGNGQCDVPPAHGWLKAGEGIDPSPTIEFLYNNNDSNDQTFEEINLI